MRIQNYRNLQDVEMTFHERANYIVGENAIGKSGLLRLISYMSAGRNVEEDDYADVTRPIVITWPCTSCTMSRNISPIRQTSTVRACASAWKCTSATCIPISTTTTAAKNCR